MGTIAKVTAGGATHLIASSAYGICSTGSGTAAKTVNFTDDQAFTLIQGTTIHVKFTYTNTAVNPTLNVKGTGAKPIHRVGGTPVDVSAINSWAAGEIVTFTYDTTQVSTGCWIMNSGHKYTADITSIGSASAGTAIAADDITAWTTNTPTAVTKKTVVLSLSKTNINDTYLGSTGDNQDWGTTDGWNETGGFDISDLLINVTASTGDSVTVTAGKAATLSYTARSIPNISVTSKTVATGISAS